MKPPTMFHLMRPSDKPGLWILKQDVESQNLTIIWIETPTTDQQITADSLFGFRVAWPVPEEKKNAD